MDDFLFLGEIQSSLARVFLEVGCALALPFFFDKTKSLHRSFVFLIAGLLSLRYLWWRAT